MALINEMHANFQLALATCKEGYYDDEIARVVAFKTAQPIDPHQIASEQAINSILAVSLAASELPGRPLRVLDFGGGCGFHYFRVASAIGAELKWAIVETTTMAKHATELARGRYTVHSTIEDAMRILDAVDLIHTSGAVQYAPDPLGALQALAALKAPYFALARFPIWHKAEIVGVQVSRLADNGEGPMPPGVANLTVRYPITFTPFADVAATLHSYELVLKTASPSAGYETNGEYIAGSSLVFRLKA